MKSSEQAVIHFQKGLNCCQAINCSYRESMGINEQQAIVLGENYGGGLYKGICGALAGNFIVINHLVQQVDQMDPAISQSTKTEQLFKKMRRDFERTHDSIYCEQLLGKKNCECYVRTAARILEQSFEEMDEALF